MCGRYSLFAPPEDLEERFEAAFDEPFSPTYNAAPGQRLPVVTDERPETIRQLEWGLIPSWADDGAEGLINARAETVDEKPSFRGAYRGRSATRDPEANATDSPRSGRCLVLADGFYEWVETDAGKRPYRIAFEDDRPFAMAGLWATWEPETTQAGLDAFAAGGAEAVDGDRRETFAIVTTEPNAVVADLHHRMAAVLEPDAERGWLEAEDPRDALDPHRPDELRAYPVSTAVNNPGNDDPSLVEPLESG